MNEKCLTEIQQIKPSDLPVLHSIDIKCHEFALTSSEIRALAETEGVHGIVGILHLCNVGFALFNIQDGGDTIFINRFSVTRSYIDRGVPEKIIDTLRAPELLRPPSILRIIVSENELDTPMFDKYLELGFRGTGVARGHFHQVGQPADGLKLELS